MKRLLIFIAGMLLIGGCLLLLRETGVFPLQQKSGSSVELGSSFTLRKGEEVRVKDTDASVRLVELIYSPCPQGAQCIWSGLGVKFELVVGNKTYSSSLDGFLSGAPYDVRIVETDYQTFARFLVTRSR